MNGDRDLSDDRSWNDLLDDFNGMMRDASVNGGRWCYSGCRDWAVVVNAVTVSDAILSPEDFTGAGTGWSAPATAAATPPSTGRDAARQG